MESRKNEKERERDEEGEKERKREREREREREKERKSERAREREQQGQKRSTYMSAQVCSRAMRWLLLVGSLNFWISFAEYSLFYRALLQKSPIILRSLIIVATP